MTVRYTSAQTYYDIKANGLLSKLRFEVYEWLFHNGPATAKQVVNALTKGSESSSTYNSRLSELRDQGVVTEVGITTCKESHQEVILWDVNSNLPMPLLHRKSDKAELLELVTIAHSILSTKVRKGKYSDVDGFVENVEKVLK